MPNKGKIGPAKYRKPAKKTASFKGRVHRKPTRFKVEIDSNGNILGLMDKRLNLDGMLKALGCLHILDKFRSVTESAPDIMEEQNLNLIIALLQAIKSIIEFLN
jgi:hypothetical protein